MENSRNFNKVPSWGAGQHNFTSSLHTTSTNAFILPTATNSNQYDDIFSNDNDPFNFNLRTFTPIPSQRPNLVTNELFENGASGSGPNFFDESCNIQVDPLNGGEAPICLMPACMFERDGLRLEVSELKSTNRALITSQQDLRNRLVTEHTQQVSELRRSIWKLENESSYVKTDFNCYNTLLIKLNKDLGDIYKKTLELCGESGNENFSFTTSSQSQTNAPYPTNMGCLATGGMRASEIVASINCKLDRALQQKRYLPGPECVEKRVSFQFTPPFANYSKKPAAGSFTGQNNAVVEPNYIELSSSSSISSLNIKEEPGSTALPAPLVQPNDFSLRDDDSDIEFLEEIKKGQNHPNSSSASNTDKSPSSSHFMDYSKPGFVCTCGRHFERQAKFDQHIRQIQFRSLQLDTLDDESTPRTTRSATWESLGSIESSLRYSPLPPARQPNLRIDKWGRTKRTNDTLVIATTQPPANPNKARLNNSLICLPNSGSSANKQSALPSTYIDENPIHQFDPVKSESSSFAWCTCGSKYASKGGVLQHIKMQEQPSNFVCGKENCNKVFPNYQAVRKHMEVCNNNQ